ncbi:StfH/YfcO family fimbrial adhesin [Escherichia coli]|uniref:StfH/YfcO family fimbrial adhesin n=1 Tax=Escherichia coli TaxID=562 RepID=UPI00228222B9|nr:StfH/YfcO family fimbrial adhesin [Escherichia coli]MCZ0305501.1 StfH/YfcO family fimbrial adhesin [Escherichia coli]MCZ0309883.1 StfH/YfcO family fimbrial adhesin [Escherichia coli]MCZ0338663.1 StfH/YfcO family fimbrial adhesin [Escherichia coli]MCZ0404840.1 StfH/YfcO family fimbrial adhesin [Escherichia coli]MCZ0478506.1 StfH/YfcO family fimbrial adhesin [Escherichia coli]
MKILRWLFALVMLMSATEALAAGHRVEVYYGTDGDWLSRTTFSLKIMMPSAVYDGEYASDRTLRTGDYLQNTSWNGPPPAPTVKLVGLNSANASSCPGLPSGWACAGFVFEVIISADIESYFSCPWLVIMSDTVTTPGGVAYKGPDGRATLCSTVSVAPYDVSWNENYVSKSKLLTLQSTGGVVEKTLSTYLMKDGKLCDSSQMITFTATGCDKAEVTVIPNRHPITDKQLHDMVVHVDTSSMQPIDSTCRFQYVLNEL